LLRGLQICHLGRNNYIPQIEWLSLSSHKIQWC